MNIRQYILRYSCNFKCIGETAQIAGCHYG
jgi:hypothetical protein